MRISLIASLVLFGFAVAAEAQQSKKSSASKRSGKSQKSKKSSRKRSSSNSHYIYNDYPDWAARAFQPARNR